MTQLEQGNITCWFCHYFVTSCWGQINIFCIVTTENSLCVWFYRAVFARRSKIFSYLYYDLTQYRKLRENRQTFLCIKERIREYNVKISSVTKFLFLNDPCLQPMPTCIPPHHAAMMWICQLDYGGA